MILLVEVVALIGLALAGHRLLPRRPAAVVVAGWLGALAGAAAFWIGVGPGAVGMVHERAHDAHLTAAQALARPGEGLGARADVLAWADATLPRHGRVYLDCPQPASCSNALANWIAYRLEPRVFTDTPAQATWVLLYRRAPDEPLPAGFALAATYARGFAVARRAG